MCLIRLHAAGSDLQTAIIIRYGIDNHTTPSRYDATTPQRHLTEIKLEDSHRRTCIGRRMAVQEIQSNPMYMIDPSH